MSFFSFFFFRLVYFWQDFFHGLKLKKYLLIIYKRIQVTAKLVTYTWTTLLQNHVHARFFVFTAKGPKCFSCSNVTTIADCRTITTCQHSEVNTFIQSLSSVCCCCCCISCYMERSVLQCILYSNSRYAASNGSKTTAVATPSMLYVQVKRQVIVNRNILSIWQHRLYV